MNKKYDSESIKVLSDRDHVRLRTQVYLGNMHLVVYEVPVFSDILQIENFEFIPAVYKSIGEIFDNAIDELTQINIPNKTIKINAIPDKGEYTISDNGRGIPIDKHSTGKFTPEVALTSLRAGRNFTDDKNVGVIGMNGVGASCVSFCSKEFSVLIHRDGKKYKQTFKNGVEKISKPSITESSTKTGTEISFTLDPEVFKTISIPDKLMRNRAIEIAFTNPGVTVQYNDEKFKYKNGLEDIVKNISNSYFKFSYTHDKANMDFYFIFDINKNLDEKVFTWVNSSFLFDGGICNTQILNAFIDKTVDHLQSQAKKQKCEITKNDIRQNLLILGNMKVSDPEYDSQAKTRLTGPNLRKEMIDMLDDQWSLFTRRNKAWMEGVLERAIVRHHSTANDKAINEHKKSLSKKIPKLIDATSKIRFNCQLIITEGDSAKGMITDVRNSETTAVLPLTGKINNVYGTTPAQLLQMGKITDLISAIGLIPGKKADRERLNYGKLIIATDADPDGGDIFTLLVNLIYQFWPELFDSKYEPFIYRLVAPNVVASKGKNRVHFTNREMFDKEKDKYKGFEITYMKGLGSMIREDWNLILSGKTDTMIPILDDSSMKDVLDLLFGDDADKRKEWLQ